MKPRYTPAETARFSAAAHRSEAAHRRLSPLKFGSWCSGIEAASEAWLPLGWQCAYVAEIEPFPCAYLHQQHGAGRPQYMPKPDEADNPKDRARRATMIRANNKLPEAGRLTNFGDISQVRASELPKVDLIAAGFPCQDFSIAGLRASLSGDRGSLSTIGVRLLLEAADLGLVRGAILEQVPDVLNTPDNAWGNILGALVGADAALEGLEHGGKWPRAGMVAGPRARVAWRILDAQHFGLAQRRERVWAVVDFGDGPDPAAVLFERKGVPRHPSARGAARKDVAPTLNARTRGGGGLGTDFDLDGGLITDGTQRWTAAEVSPTLTREFAEQTGQDATNGFHVVETVAYAIQAGCVRENPESGPDGVGVKEGHAYTLEARAEVQAVAYSIMPQNSGKDYKAREVDVAQPLMASGPVGGDQGGDYILQPIAFNARQDPIYGPVVGPVDTDGGTHAIAFSLRGREGGAMPEVEAGDVSPSLRAAEGGSTRPFVANEMAVRRITVVEAEILQGFPPNATLIDWPSANRKGEDLAETITYLIGHGFTPAEATDLAQTPDGPRYKAIGNSWPVTVPRWIGERIDAIEAAA